MKIRKRIFNLRVCSFELRFYPLLLVVIIFFCASTVSANKRQIVLYEGSDTKEESDSRRKLPDDVWRHIASFLQEKESYVLGQLDRKITVRDSFLKRTGTSASFKKIKKIFEQHRKENQEIEEELEEKKIFFCIKHSCLPVWYVIEISASTVTWVAVGALALYTEAIRALALKATTCVHWTSEVVTCSSNPEENTAIFVEDTCACLFCREDEFTLRRCLWYSEFWRVQEPAERKAFDEKELTNLRRELEKPPIIPPKEEKMQRD